MKRVNVPGTGIAKKYFLEFYYPIKHFSSDIKSVFGYIKNKADGSYEPLCVDGSLRSRTAIFF
jgi:hypothetical protein